ncbi:MAG: TetR/AcrR family transcriptional regulator [Vicinamibacterales bacterium]
MDDTTPEGRRERHRRETFERLVRAAREIMFSRGFNDITVQDITEAADVGKGTFFNYFRSKEHVVSRVFEYNRRSVARAVEDIRTQQVSYLDALTNVMMGALCPAGGEWLTYQTNTMRALALNTEVRMLVAQEMTRTRQDHEAMVALGQEQGSVRRDISSADLAMVQQTFLAGLTVLLWIHSTTPTRDMVVDITRKFFALLAAPKAEAVKPAAAAPARRATKPKPRPAKRAQKPSARAKARSSRRR